VAPADLKLSVTTGTSGKGPFYERHPM
jgi:hypothetical protein